MSQNSFLKQSEEIRSSYLIILGAIASADRENSPEELAFMEQMSLAANLSDTHKTKVSKALTNSKGVDLTAHLNKLKGSDIKFALVTDLLNLSYKDGDLEKSEVDAIKQINTVLGVSDDQFNALQQYVKAANKEVSNSAGTAEVDADGNAKEEKTNFLEDSGLNNMFRQMGIPVDNFTSGSTVGSQLTSTAFFLLQNYIKGNTKESQGSLGSSIGGFIGSALSNMKSDPKDGETGVQAGGMGQMVAGFFASEAGKSTINNVLNNVVSSAAEGKGMGNLMDIIGGGKKDTKGGGSAAALGSILSAFMQK